jgi:hypothetical protein
MTAVLALIVGLAIGTVSGARWRARQATIRADIAHWQAVWIDAQHDAIQRLHHRRPAKRYVPGSEQ